MKLFKYFFEFLFINIIFFIFNFLSYKTSSNLGEKIGKWFGPFFRNKNVILKNLKKADFNIESEETHKLISEMWGNYGRILSEYPFIKSFNKKLSKKYVKVYGIEILDRLQKENKKAVFISGHFNNFELMPMHITKQGIDLAAIYRPLNNIFLNKKMESIRTKYICKKQIKKGIAGTREIIKLVKQGYSIALMIDQRVSEGVKSKFFNDTAFTTTIPAQLCKKYNMEIVPVYIERKYKFFFNIYFYDPLDIGENESIENITDKLNLIMQRLIMKNPSQWIWTHDRWK